MKLGAQSQNTPGELAAFIGKTKPKIWKLLGNALNIDTARAIKTVSPDTFVVGRYFVADQPYGNPVADARNFADTLLRFFEPYGSAINAIEGYNEIIIFNPDDAKRYNEFQVELSRRLRAGGRKSVAYNFSVGHPELFYVGLLELNEKSVYHLLTDRYDLPVNLYEPLKNPANWGDPVLRDSIKQLLTGKVDPSGGMWQYLLDGVYESDYLGLHEYGAPDIYRDSKYLALRHRSIVEWLASEFLRLGKQKYIEVLVTESGLDFGILPGHPLSGFKANGVSIDSYKSQLLWYNEELEKDSYVLGSTIFLFGFSDSRWESFDLSDPDSRAMFEQVLLSSPIEPPPDNGGSMEIVDYVFPPALTQVGACGEQGIILPDKPFYRIMGATVRQGVSAFMVVNVYNQDGSPKVGAKVVNLFPDGNGEVQETDASGKVEFYFGASSAFTNPCTGNFTVFIAETAYKDFDAIPKRVVYSNILSDIVHSLGDFRGDHTEIYMQFKDRPLKPTEVPTDYVGDQAAAVLKWGSAVTGINLNPEAALQRRAKELGWIRPLTNESRIRINGIRYAVQAFPEGLVYCIEGDWGHVSVVYWL